MTFINLGAGWTVRSIAGPVPAHLSEALSVGIPATVPGVVHTDLLAAGLVPDPYIDDNEALLSWIGETDWRYRCVFDWQPSEDRLDLVADGLDTVATIRLNGRVVARTANQHRSWRWDVSSVLRAGANELEIDFGSAIAYARERERVLGERPHSYSYPFNAIRKMACNFGWDWGPALVTAGIWKRIGLESWSAVRVASVRPIVSIDDGARRVDAHVALEWESDAMGSAKIDVAVGGATASAEASAGDTSVTVVLEVPGAELWWPRGHGSQPLYPIEVTARDSCWTGRVGFRSVELDLEPDEDGSPFRVIVNGEDVFIRGANWIPDDTFPTRLTRERLAISIGDAVDAGLNLLRVWGGGLYESEDFYELCDELGLLVWQDFLLACAAYSEDEELWAEFEAEARQAVTRLSAHPSLAIWNGGNENIWGYIDWNWRTRLDGATWGEGYYRRLFPSIVEELAPGTPYSDGSPFGFSDYVHPNDPAHGTTHLWEVWNRIDYSHYRDYQPRFVSEFGFQGPADHSTLFSAVHDDPADPHGPLMLVHQKATDGNGKLERGLGVHLPAPATIDDWHWATQLNQARAVAFGIEHFRSLFPLNRGSIVWQLNDCWPVVSWAAVDGHGRRKPLWHALARVSADRLATIQPRDGGLALILHNDSSDRWVGDVTLRRIDLRGRELERCVIALDVPERGAVTMPIPNGIAVPEEPEVELLVADLPGARALWYFVEDPLLALEPRPFTTTAWWDGRDVVVEVTASGLVKDLTLQVDRADPRARADRALVTLLPGETVLIRVNGGAADAAAFIAPGVVRTANDLVAKMK